MTAKIEKAAYGRKCNHCRRCCKEALCDLADMVFGSETPAPCPALEGDGQEGFCGLAAHPGRYIEPGDGTSEADMREAALFLTGAGLGCDYQEPGERAPLLYRWRVARRQRRTARNPGREFFRRLRHLSGRLRSGRQRSASRELAYIVARLRPPPRTGL